MANVKRQTTRLSSWDYSRPGCYFVTVCTHERGSLFGLVRMEGEGVGRAARMLLNDRGLACERAIIAASETYREISVDAFVIMPNHMHLLLAFEDTGDSKPSARSLLSRFVGFVKTRTTRTVRETYPKANVWQRGFHDHIVRNEEDYLRIWEYIENNPARWTQDRYYLEDTCSR